MLKPDKHYQLWSKSDIESLIKLSKADKNDDEIAKQLGRSVYAVRQKRTEFVLKKKRWRRRSRCFMDKDGLKLGEAIKDFGWKIVPNAGMDLAIQNKQGWAVIEITRATAGRQGFVEVTILGRIMRTLRFRKEFPFNRIVIVVKNGKRRFYPYFWDSIDEFMKLTKLSVIVVEVDFSKDWCSKVIPYLKGD